MAKTSIMSADGTIVSQRERYSVLETRDIVIAGKIIKGGQAKPSICLLRSSCSGSIKKVVGKTFNNKRAEFAQWYYKYELMILKYLSPHPSIVGLFDQDIMDAPPNTLFLEYLPSGDLLEWTREIPSYFIPEVVLWKLLYQMADALAFLHHRKGIPGYNPVAPYALPYGFVHRDIKMENILVAGPESSEGMPSIRKADFKLCDFGMADCLDHDGFKKKPRMYQGTRDYQAPEAAHFPYLAGPSQDIWALACCLHKFFSHSFPLKMPCNKDCDEKYTRGDCKEHATTDQELQESETSNVIALPSEAEVESPEPLETITVEEKQVAQPLQPTWSGPKTLFREDNTYKKGYSNYLLDTIRRCLSIDPDQRPTAIELCVDIEPIYNAIQAGKFDWSKAGCPLPLDNVKYINKLRRDHAGASATRTMCLRVNG